MDPRLNQRVERFLYQCCKEYYIDDKPSISDAVYDDLKRKLVQEYEDVLGYVPAKSVINMVGYDDKWFEPTILGAEDEWHH